MSIDKRFALIADNGDVLFPYTKMQQATGRTGFALSAPGSGDRHGEGEYTADLGEVVRRVVLDGYGVRMRTEGKATTERDGSFRLGKTATHRFYVAQELERFARGSDFTRVDRLPTQRLDRLPLAVSASPGVASPKSLLAQIDSLNADDYADTLRANEAQLSVRQRTMLSAHARAPGMLLSMRQLASAGGLDSYASANLEYGAVGHVVADDQGLDSPGNWTQFLAEVSTTKATDGEHGWVMRKPLAEALKTLGWSDPWINSLEAQAAQIELTSEPGFASLPETTRRALVEARVGQGGFRRRMLKLWEGRCAVTGCAIEQVLIASHAKAWKSSTTDERLDEFNGLPLVATLDRLFDRGLIGFADDGVLLKQANLDWRDLDALGIAPGAALRIVHPKNIQYLQHHRGLHQFASDASDH